MESSGHTFTPRDLVAGHIVLDLVNTVTARDAEPIDWLDGYPRLLEWATLTGRFDQDTLTTLHRAAAAAPSEAARALSHTRELREALHDLIAALIRDGHPATPDTLHRVENYWKDAVAHARLAISGSEVQPRISVEISGLECLNHELALHAFDLLRTLPRERTRICPGQRCGWMFIDHSRGGRRRWCDMATCGNAAKGRTHYQRQRPTANHKGHDLPLRDRQGSVPDA